MADAIVEDLLRALAAGYGPSLQGLNGDYQITPAIDNLSQPRDHRGHAGLAAVERDAEDWLDVTCVSQAEGSGQGMEKKRPIGAEPAWLDPRNDRKTPYTDAELDRLTDDQIAMMADTAAWRDLVAEFGKERARETVKGRLAGRDPYSLINWEPGGPLH